MSERIKISVIAEKGKKTAELFHSKEKTLLHTLREGGVALPSLCSHRGKCGRCLVRFQGYAPLPAQADRAMIAPDKLRDGYRLACMARPVKDCTVEIFFAEERKIDVVVASKIGNGPQGDKYWSRKAEASNMVEMDCHEEGTFDMAEMAHHEKNTSDRKERVSRAADGCNGKREIWAGDLCGGKRENGIRMAVAVDIGTTTIAMQMIEAGTGRILDTYTCLNPQRGYGTDVISRIQAGAGGEGEALQRLVREALSAGIRQMEKNAGGGIRYRTVCIVISANTAMGHLFMGYPVETLGKSPFLPVDIKTVKLEYLGVPTVLVPGISAFVGGDIVSGLYACGFFKKQSGKAWLFMDLGTNAEMVMGKGNRIVCTAAAAGSTFEGRGEDGAAGSERISAIAYLLERGIIEPTGLLAEPYFETGIEVEVMESMQPAEAGHIRKKIRIFKEDIRDIQMAKAAVRAGIHFLMEHLSLKDYDEIEKVYVAGGLGFYLDGRAAAVIGLIPPNLADKIEAMGNTSLAGARLLGEEILKKFTEAGKEPDLEAVERLEKFAQEAEVFQLAEEPAFEKVYVDYMNFT